MYKISVYSNIYAYSTHDSRSDTLAVAEPGSGARPPHLALDELGHAFRGGVGAVGGPESVVDVVVA